MAGTANEFEPVVVQTCEEHAAGERQHLLRPQHDDPITQFLVQNPFGLRKAIVPMFRADTEGRLHGMGTAFAADSWGTFLTADHVIDLVRSGGPQTGPANEQIFTFGGDHNLIALLGIGLIFGTMGIPQEALARIVETFSPAIQIDDPLAFTRGGVDHKALDIAVLKSATRPPPDMIRNLPIRLGYAGPRVGDVVVAVGYPQIDTVHGNVERVATRVEEGMFAGYGRVTALHPHGRDRSQPTPVFEVAADWPSGMSGGPVFNMAGEVIGLVSRGLAPEEGERLGTAWATWFEALPQLPSWAPTLDPLNPGHRRVWGARRFAPWSLAGVAPTQAEASALAAAAGPDFEVVHGSWPIGTDDLISSGADQ